MKCEKCGSIKTERGHYTRGWNNMCNQAAGDKGYYCKKCGHITFESTLEEYLNYLPYWCSFGNEQGKAGVH